MVTAVSLFILSLLWDLLTISKTDYQQTTPFIQLTETGKPKMQFLLRVLLKFWELFSLIKAYNSACPTPIHRDLEQGVFRSHSLRFAGGVTRSQKRGRGKRGLREGGRHGEDKVAVNSARWRMTHTQTHRHPDTHVKVRWTKGQKSQEAIDN